MGPGDDTQAYYDRMTELGDLLLKAMRLEESLGKICAKKQSAENIEEWKQARRTVDALTADYTVAVREWYVLVDAQISRQISRHDFGTPIPAK